MRVGPSSGLSHIDEEIRPVAREALDSFERLPPMSEPGNEDLRESRDTLGARVDVGERDGERCVVCPAKGECLHCWLATMRPPRAGSKVRQR